jgi:hypothetical protein
VNKDHLITLYYVIGCNWQTENDVSNEPAVATTLTEGHE